MSTQIILPRILQVGAGASQEIPSVLVSLGCKQPLIITDKMMVELGYAARIQNCLAPHQVSADIRHRRRQGKRRKGQQKGSVPISSMIRCLNLRSAPFKRVLKKSVAAITTASSPWAEAARSIAPRPSPSWPSLAARCVTISSRASFMKWD